VGINPCEIHSSSGLNCGSRRSCRTAAVGRGHAVCGSALLVCLLVTALSQVSCLKCYVSIDSPCQVDKGQNGGCLQDIGVAVECPPQFSASCMTVFRLDIPTRLLCNW